MEEENVNLALVYYTITPALNVEGDEEDTEILRVLLEVIENGTAQYAGWTFADKPERLAVSGGPGVTDVVFTLDVRGLTPFNNEADFKESIIEALRHSAGVQLYGNYHDDGTVKRMDVSINKIWE